ncbi:hypothetical protein COX95_01465 [bacterium CG_4_10_14_0_2_um_filter_33_32]|nr:MAG: hypothetical protein COX95_01465 [bacterium CG_4_10_14_0_2_um_filter_33_32]PJA71861.1 MAG: hypothetical protein CO152_04450 [bacterium CG_4_9_14_3_um_filter_33_26]
MRSIILRVKEFIFKIFKLYREFFSNFYFREKLILFICSVLIIVSLFSLVLKSYKFFTHEVPIEGGSYIEGIVGQPRNINPLYAPSNMVDRSLSYLIYSGLTKIDEKGNIIPDIAERWEVKDNGKVFNFKLKHNVKWHDGEQLLSNDIRYTISVIQDPDYTGPLKNEWKDVEVEVPDEYTVVFNLSKPQPSFIYNTTLGILPEHIWAEFEVKDLPYVEQNLKPIGSNRFKFKETKTTENDFVKIIILEKNRDFYDKKPYIDSVVFKFYDNSEKVFDALAKREIMGTANLNQDTYKKVKDWNKYKIFSYILPSYKAVFMNYPKNKLLESIDFRKALELSINKNDLINNKLLGVAICNNGIFIHNDAKNHFDINAAKELLQKIGLKDTNNDGFLEKDNKEVEFKISILDDNESKIVGEFIKESFAKIGIHLNIEKKNLLELERDVIRPRNYELLFFGQNLGFDLDLFSFWHSSQQKDPGLNFTSFSSKKTDIILENALKIEDREKKKEVSKKVEEYIQEEHPAIFLYSPVFNFVLDKKVKGFNKQFLVYPEQRFLSVDKWYIKTQRVLNK